MSTTPGDVLERKNSIDKLIVCSPFAEPAKHWRYRRAERLHDLVSGRRPAGYVSATPGLKNPFDDPGVFHEIELVNRIRERVKTWREANYPGVTGITRRLLEHWTDSEERGDHPFFFCQLEAIETLIWLSEAPTKDRVGISIEGDGGDFERVCSKMATGTGKTVVMAMIVAWQVLNKVSYRQDDRYSKNVLIVAPGLTVKNRLSVLYPSAPDNYYEQFNIVPTGLRDKLRLGQVKVINWHALAWATEEQLKKKKSVDKRGSKSDEAYVREVLGELAQARNLIVLNDEAHHAWRGDLKDAQIDKEEKQKTTIWIGGLDRIHKQRRILRCFDLSATPFIPAGKKNKEEQLFNWIVSDFGLNDAIEAGLVKTPRIVVRDGGRRTKEGHSQLYHIYANEDVKTDLNRKGALEGEQLPKLVTEAYNLLGADWLATFKDWQARGNRIPPVMITVANRTETSGRIKFAFDTGMFQIDELCEPAHTLKIDSSLLAKAEAGLGDGFEPKASDDDEVEESSDTESEEEVVTDIITPKGQKITKKQQMELLRRQVDTVGKVGQPGEQIRHVISVAMLSEGWDAKTVTHIMGLRAFTSQLLCEQVIGRGLRRTSYEVGPDGLYQPEYVNIFGVPFSFMPHEGGEEVTNAPVTKIFTRIEPDRQKQQFEIAIPNILRIETIYKPRLEFDLASCPPLELDPDSITDAELAEVIAGKPKLDSLTTVDLENVIKSTREQTLIFKAAKAVLQNQRKNWRGPETEVFAQLLRIVEQFLSSDKIHIPDVRYSSNPIKERVLKLVAMNKIVNHVAKVLRATSLERLKPTFDKERPFIRTSEMRPWNTTKKVAIGQKTHINYVIADSGWENTYAYHLDKDDSVDAYVKNDHLGVVIYYNYEGKTPRYIPDYIVRKKDGSYLLVEIKGQKDERDKAKEEFVKMWVEAVNNQGNLGKWDFKTVDNL